MRRLDTTDFILEGKQKKTKKMTNKTNKMGNKNLNRKLKETMEKKLASQARALADINS